MKTEKLNISSWCLVRNGFAVCNGVSLLRHTSVELETLLKDLYKILHCNYPKFYKMDDLSKLAFVASEALIKNKELNYPSDEIALVFSNASASLDTDVHYFNSVSDKSNYFPSPAVYVYTLPNVMVGEICIRNKFTGENAFFISEKFDAELLASYAENILSAGKAKCVIAGWVEINETYYEAVLFLIENDEEGDDELNRGSMEDVYNRGRLDGKVEG